jgi:hypothetical protein
VLAPPATGAHRVQPGFPPGWRGSAVRVGAVVVGIAVVVVIVDVEVVVLVVGVVGVCAVAVPRITAACYPDQAAELMKSVAHEDRPDSDFPAAWVIFALDLPRRCRSGLPSID